MPEVKSRKIIFVNKTLTASGTFEHDFRIGFDVDDMIVLNWTCNHSTIGDDAVLIMHMDRIGDIFSFFNQESITLRTPFRINSSLDGVQSFKVKDINGTIATTLNNLQISFCLEFIEYYRD